MILEITKVGTHLENIKEGYYTVLRDGRHRTFHITTSPGDRSGKLLVGIMVGADNVMDYEYIGYIDPAKRFHYFDKFKSKSGDVQKFDVIEDALKTINGSKSVYGFEKVLNSENCWVCRRLLTNPRSIKYGIGKKCRAKIGMILEEDLIEDALYLKESSEKPVEKIGDIRI